MNKLLKLAQKIPPEPDLINHSDLKNQLRENAVYDLENLGSDFQHMSSVVQSVKQNYQAVLAENRKLKSTLMSLVNECYCWQGNRCERCQRILKSLEPELLENQKDSAPDHQEIIAKLRSRKTGIKT